MSDIPSQSAMVALMGAGDQEWEAFPGMTFPALYALMTRRHMREYGTTMEQISQISVKNHHHANLNEKAQFQFEVTIDKVMDSTLIADPLRLLHCSPLTDGAAAIVLASEEKIKELTDNPVWIKGTGVGTDTLSLHDRESLSRIDSIPIAAKKAYETAEVEPEDIDVAEVHDCFTPAEIMAIEGLGFCKLGEGGKFTEEGETSLEGSIPINTSGGLKGKGHPVGATGIAQAIECAVQLRGEGGKRQVEDAELALSQNVGGSGATCVVHVFSKTK